MPTEGEKKREGKAPRENRETEMHRDSNSGNEMQLCRDE